MSDFYLQIEDELLSRDNQRAEERRVNDIRRLSDAMKWVLSDEKGRAFIFWCIERGGFLRDDYNGRSLDLAYQAGQKSICSEITGLALAADPGIFAKFVKEKLNKET